MAAVHAKTLSDIQELFSKVTGGVPDHLRAQLEGARSGTSSSSPSPLSSVIPDVLTLKAGETTGSRAHRRFNSFIPNQGSAPSASLMASIFGDSLADPADVGLQPVRGRGRILGRSGDELLRQREAALRAGERATTSMGLGDAENAGLQPL